MLRSGWLPALALCLAACTFDSRTPANLMILCQSDDDCAGAQTCRSIGGVDQCLGTSVVSSVEIFPRAAKAGDLVTMRVETAGEANIIPRVQPERSAAVEPFTEVRREGSTIVFEWRVSDTMADGEPTPEGLHSVVVLSAAVGMSLQAVAAGTLRIDLTPPAVAEGAAVVIAPKPNAARRDPTALGPNTTLRVSLAFSEPLGRPPQLACPGLSDVQLTRLGTAATPYTFEGEISALGVEGRCEIQVTAVDEVGNTATQPSVPIRFTVDSRSPESPDVDLASAARVLHDLSSTTSSRSVSGGPGSVEPNSIVLTLADSRLESELGRGSADDAGAYGPVLSGERDRSSIFVAVVDAAANVSEPRAIRHMRWVARPAGAPSRLAARAVSSSELIRASEPRLPAIGARNSDGGLTLIRGGGALSYERATAGPGPWYGGCVAAWAWGVPHAWRSLFDGEGWKEAQLSWPEGRVAFPDWGGLAYDRRRAVLVGFGGYLVTPEAETWELDGVSVHALAFTSQPSARARPAMAYDEARGLTVLAGGTLHVDYFAPTTLTDTWAYDGSTWRRLAATVPHARDQSMTYLPTTASTMLLSTGTSGRVGAGLYRLDWPTEQWVWVADAPAFEPFGIVSLAWEPATQRLIATGKKSGSQAFSRFAHQADGGWEELPPLQVPSDWQQFGAACVDPVTNRLLYVTHHYGATDEQNQQLTWRDTPDGGTDIVTRTLRLDFDGQPLPRTGHAAFVNDAGVLHIVGGWQSSGMAEGSWSWAGAGWRRWFSTLPEQPSSPAVMYSSVGASAQLLRCQVPSLALPETVSPLGALVRFSATALASSRPAQVCRASAAVAALPDGRPLIIGGATSRAPGGDFFDTIVTVAADGGAQTLGLLDDGVMDPAAAWHSASNQLVVVGGLRETAGIKRAGSMWSLYQLAGGGQQLVARSTPAGPTPSARAGGVLVDDPHRGELIYMGGYEARVVNNDWQYAPVRPDVWTWRPDGGWDTLMLETKIPGVMRMAARMRHVAVYDPVRHRVLFQGGNYPTSMRSALTQASQLLAISPSSIDLERQRPAITLHLEPPAGLRNGAAHITAIVVSATGVGRGEVDGQPVSGIELQVWRAGRWQSAGAAVGPGEVMATAQLPVSGRIDEYFGDGLRFGLQVVPVGTNGTGFSELGVAQTEVVIDYAL